MLPQLISMGDTIYVDIGCLPWLVVAAVQQRISAEGRHYNVLIVLFHCQDNEGNFCSVLGPTPVRFFVLDGNKATKKGLCRSPSRSSTNAT